MTHSTARMDELREAGATAIRRHGRHERPMLHLEQDGVVFLQMFEYPVADFELEVGFFVRVFGLPTLALTDGYALFAHPDGAYGLSFRKDATLAPPSTIGLKLLFMTRDVEGARTQLQETGLVPDLAIRRGSPTQRVIHFATPSGVAVEIWEFPSTADS
jgi:hypothetical protein